MTVLLLLALGAPPLDFARDRQDAEELRPGLVAAYRSGGTTLTRIDLKPAFTWGLSSPHPRLAPGPFEATWTGFFILRESEPVRFGAQVGGEVTVTIDGEAVLNGPFARRPGIYPIRVEYRSIAAVPARLQIWWEGKGFSREPLPAWLLKHRRTEMQNDEEGRAAVARFGCARCHSSAFPGVTGPPPGPSLADAGRRLNRAWLVELSHNPTLFSDDPKGLAERRIVADHLLGTGGRVAAPTTGDHRLGKRYFASLGCVACHPVADAENPPPFDGLADRLPHAELAAFLGNPHSRYPDGRMPRIPMPPEQARDIAAYLLLWSKPAMADAPAEKVADGRNLLREKRCAQCHTGIGDSTPQDVPIRKAGADCSGVRFALDEGARKSIAGYMKVAAQEIHPSPFDARQRLLVHHGCLKCHARDTDRPPPLEEVGSRLGGAFLQRVPYQRTPRLSNAHAKYTREYLVASIRDGVSKVRPDGYTYRMPAFGDAAEAIVQALAEGDGDLVDAPAPAAAPPDPTLHALGPRLVGFEGYSCISCHIWGGRAFAESDPGAVGPELTTVTRRIRRDWFDRWLEDPARAQPGTPMPAIFKHGDVEAAKQKDALWAYFAKGRDAPAPKPLPPTPVAVPADGPLVAQIPVHLPDKSVIESICVLYATHDLLVYDVGAGTLRGVYTGARLQRHVKGRTRQFVVEGVPVPWVAPPTKGTFAGYDLLPDGVRVRSQGGDRTIRLAGRTLLLDDAKFELPAAATPPALEPVALSDAARPEGALERPGYRATAWPRPKTASGEDLVMPGAIAADPRSGRVFVASMKQGEIFEALDGRFENHARGLFQEAYSMLHDGEALYVLHRRNLTRVADTDGNGRADRFDRVIALPHGIANTYDYGYGLVRGKDGAFVLSYAPYSSTGMPGSGSMLKIWPGDSPRQEEVAFGFRNPLGWCAGPEGEVFFTDNQGEWVASSKLCHIVKGRFYGFPNSAQKEHAKKPPGRAAVWVPYPWARSINGVTYDDTGGKFGPFTGQIFMAELMYGGAIIRANVERVNGEVQGACFPFWGKGLLGPVTLAFDPKGRLWVGGITEPGWMAQPDRGALFRIDFTGDVPFEIRSIHARPRGFRFVFTQPIDAKTASFAVERYRYEYTGSYGSPELDRTPVEVERVEVAPDGLSLELTLPALVKERVYMIAAPGVRSAKGIPLVHPAGAYTLNEIPER